jgi:hypothetical protein
MGGGATSYARSDYHVWSIATCAASETEAKRYDQRMADEKERKNPGRWWRWLLWPALVVLALNIEYVATKIGADQLLNWMVERGGAVLAGLSHAITSPITLYIALILVGGGLYAWTSYIFRRHWARPADAEASSSAQPSREEFLSALTERISGIYRDLSMAIGREDRFASDAVIASCEAFMLDLSRRNDIKIPELREGGTQAGALRVLAFLNEVLPTLQLDDDEEARRRAASIVPKLNAKNEDELRADMDIPRLFPREDAKPIPTPPPVGPNVLPPVQRTAKGPHYEYPKAVLQVNNTKVSWTNSPNGRIFRVSGYIIVRNDSYTSLKQCKVVLISISADGVVESVMEPFDSGSTLIGGGLGGFEIAKGHFKPIGIITRDLFDEVSKPPYLLNLAVDRRPLKDATEYQLRLELQSEYQYPTVVDVVVRTGEGDKLKITLQGQFVGSR